MEDNSIIILLFAFAGGLLIGFIIGLWPFKLTMKRHLRANPQVGALRYLQAVFPATEPSVYCAIPKEKDRYGGAHTYLFKKCMGYNESLQKVIYLDDCVEINFVQKLESGETAPGLQSEQLIIALLDRTIKLNEAYPHAYNHEMIAGLQHYLNACKKRINDRLSRGVMGQL